MFKNNFLIALRSLSKNRVSSFINIAGLAVGMAVALLIALWVWDELTYDRYFPYYERIAQVMQHQTFNGHKGTESSIPIPLEPELRSKYGHNFQYLAMASWQGEHILSFGDKKVIQEGNYMDKDITRILSLPMLKGTDDGLKELNSIMLSKSAAQSLFGAAEPIGKLIKIDNLLEVKVTGVYEDLPFNTEFHDLEYVQNFLLINKDRLLSLVCPKLKSNDWEVPAHDRSSMGSYRKILTCAKKTGDKSTRRNGCNPVYGLYRHSMA